MTNLDKYQLNAQSNATERLRERITRLIVDDPEVKHCADVLVGLQMEIPEYEELPDSIEYWDRYTKVVQDAMSSARDGLVKSN